MTRASPARTQRRLESDHRMVHVLVKKTAQEMAGAYYEWQATHTKRANDFYANYPSLDKFVRRDWPNFVRVAKEVLASMLADLNVSEIEKWDIYEALSNDATLPYSQQEMQITGFRH